jgi:hypothetical protein
MFNTPQADMILAALQVFPPDNPWNTDISQQPLLANSAAMIATIGPDEPFWYNLDMGFILVPPNQPLVNSQILVYPDESDPGPYPIPNNAPIEGWPLDGLTLAQAQMGVQGGDRHMLVVDPVNGMLYEFWESERMPFGNWTCANEATFDLKTNALRPAGWTSADAAGLPIFPAAVKYEEVQRGMVEHAMRCTFENTRHAYVYPARHYASSKTNPNFPRMGERFRLRADFDITGYPRHVQAILKGLKKYGMFVAENGENWLISIAPDARIRGLDTLKTLHGSDFEVVEPATPPEGS